MYLPAGTANLSQFRRHRGQTARCSTAFPNPLGHFMLATENDPQVNRYWDSTIPKRWRTLAALRQGIRRVQQRLRGGGKAPAACRCSCGLPFERRDRFPRSLGTGGAKPPRSLRAFTITLIMRSTTRQSGEGNGHASRCGILLGSRAVRRPCRPFSDAIAQAALAVNTTAWRGQFPSRAVREAQFKVVPPGKDPMKS